MNKDLGLLILVLTYTILLCGTAWLAIRLDKKNRIKREEEYGEATGWYNSLTDEKKAKILDALWKHEGLKSMWISIFKTLN